MFPLKWVITWWLTHPLSPSHRRAPRSSLGVSLAGHTFLWCILALSGNLIAIYPSRAVQSSPDQLFFQPFWTSCIQDFQILHLDHLKPLKPSPSFPRNSPFTLKALVHLWCCAFYPHGTHLATKIFDHHPGSQYNIPLIIRT